jgi:hypothetical protein
MATLNQRGHHLPNPWIIGIAGEVFDLSEHGLAH